jgi:hypothetical protein
MAWYNWQEVINSLELALYFAAAGISPLQAKFTPKNKRRLTTRSPLSARQAQARASTYSCAAAQRPYPGTLFLLGACVRRWASHRRCEVVASNDNDVPARELRFDAVCNAARRLWDDRLKYRCSAVGRRAFHAGSPLQPAPKYDIWPVRRMLGGTDNGNTPGCPRAL